MIRSMRALALVFLISCSSGSIGTDEFAGGDPATGDPRAGEPGPVAGDAVAGDPIAGDPHAGDPVAGGDGGPTSVDECANPGADWVFCSSFEEGNKDIWDDYDGNPDSTNLLMADPGPFDLPDNHVMRLRVPPGRGGADLLKVLPSTASRMYARWYIKWEAGYDFSAPNHGGGLHAGDRSLLGRSDYQPDGNDWFSGWVEPDPATEQLYVYSYYRGMYQDCANPDGACWGDHFPCTVDEGQTFCERAQHRETVLPPVLTDDRWYCVEIMIDGATPSASEPADGQLDFWVDGLEIGPWTDLWLRTTPNLEVSILWLNLFHHGDHSVEGVMYDHVVVSQSRVGCL